MNRIILGATLTVGLLLGLNGASFAAGDGLDRDAASQGNSTFAGQHSVARNGGAMVGPRMGAQRVGSSRMSHRRMMRHKRHRH